MKLRCPFPALLAGYVLAVFVGDLVATRVFHVSTGRGWVPFGLFLALAATIEILARRGVECPYLESGGPSRVALYAALFVVTFIVILPGVSLDSLFMPFFRWLLSLFSVSVAAMLWIHVRVDHGPSEVGVVSRGALVVSRLPLYFLVSICVGVIILGIIGRIMWKHP